MNITCSIFSDNGKSRKISDIIVSTKSVFLVWIWAVAGQISQTGNMTSTQGISRVLVTGVTSVGQSTLITEVTVSHLRCLLALTLLGSHELYLPKTNSAMYGTAYFITTASSLSSDRLYLVTTVARTESSHHIPTDPR
jgi:hypothetical protein